VWSLIWAIGFRVEKHEGGIPARNLSKKRLDEKVNIEDEQAFEMTRRLAREEGLMVGMSSGAAMVMAINLTESLEQGTVVVIFPDGGERYLSTPLFAVQEKNELCFSIP
jgi:cysteinyl-tRNA synthetase